MLLTACSSKPLWLETKDTSNFSVTEQSVNGVTTLMLRGLAFHSAYVVKEVTTDTDQNAQTMTVWIALSKERVGRSGSFVSKVSVPDHVTTVLMGNERIKIWTRAEGSLFFVRDKK